MLFAAVELGTALVERLHLFAIARLQLSELLRVVEGGLKVELVVAALAARHAGGGLFEHPHIHRSGGGVGEVKVLIGNEAIDNGARILPLRLVLFGDRLACLGEGEVLAPSAADRTAPIRGDIAVLSEALQGAVKGGLFERILPVALLFDLCNDLVAVFVAVVQSTQDDGVDVPADEIGADRLFRLCLGALFRGVFLRVAVRLVRCLQIFRVFLCGNFFLVLGRLKKRGAVLLCGGGFGGPFFPVRFIRRQSLALLPVPRGFLLIVAV